MRERTQERIDECAAGTHIPILSRSEILLRPLNTTQTATQFVNAFFQTTCLLCQRRGFRWGDRTGFRFDHDIEIDQLLREGRHIVGETEGILSQEMGRENVITLPFAFSFNDDYVGWICNSPIDIE